MQKNFVLDTNVLLHDPNSLYNFEDNTVVIPITVIEELDSFKRELNERGRNARTSIRNLDELCREGSLSEGVPLPDSGKLHVHVPNDFSSSNGKPNVNNDNKILKVAIDLSKAKAEPTILVSKDLNLRVKAEAFGIHAEDYETDHILPSDLYKGHPEIHISSALFQELHEVGYVTTEQLQFPEDTCNYCTLLNEDHPQSSALVRISGGKVHKISEFREKIWGIRPINREQRFAFDALLNIDVPLVTLMGKAGTGKTLLALAAGMKLVAGQKEYHRMIVARPTYSMGKELGFLPGSLDEKLEPWMKPIHDALELLTDLNMGSHDRQSEDMLRNGTILIEALSYIRGRSIPNQFMIIDEAQNLTPLEAKTIVTRVGGGTKIVFTGDPSQIDNPYVDKKSNGFNYLVNQFQGQALAAHVELTKGERSELAELAADLL
jgi:PhoH-like ATPase